MNTKTLLLLALPLALLCAGCSTLADARAGKGKGLSYVYEGSFDQVWSTVPKAIQAMGGGGPKVVSENKQEGYILAQGGMSFVSYGENVAIFVDKIDDAKTKVEIVSKRALATNIAAADWAPRLHKKLAEMLKRVPSDPKKA